MIWNHFISFLGYGDLIVCHRSMYKISAVTLLKDTFSAVTPSDCILCIVFVASPGFLECSSYWLVNFSRKKISI